MWTKLVAAGAGSPGVMKDIAELGCVSGKIIYVAIGGLRKAIEAAR